MNSKHSAVAASRQVFLGFKRMVHSQVPISWNAAAHASWLAHLHSEINAGFSEKSVQWKKVIAKSHCQTLHAFPTCQRERVLDAGFRCGLHVPILARMKRGGCKDNRYRFREHKLFLAGAKEIEIARSISSFQLRHEPLIKTALLNRKPGVIVCKPVASCTEHPEDASKFVLVLTVSQNLEAVDKERDPCTAIPFHEADKI